MEGISEDINQRSRRPLIDINGLTGIKITHNGSPCRVVLRRTLISVGCADVTPQALEFILQQYHKTFPSYNTEVVLQN